MALFYIGALQEISKSYILEKNSNRDVPPFEENAKSYIERLNQELDKKHDKFDIFLSHSSLDAIVVLGLLLDLTSMGYKVYVDWIYDKLLDRSNVTAATAEQLRKRMLQSDSLFYATTEHAPGSKWMPWELGYKDGDNNLVAILPVTAEKNTNNQYKGQEYLGLYPYAVKNEDKQLYICKDQTSCTKYKDWTIKNQKAMPSPYPSHFLPRFGMMQ